MCTDPMKLVHQLVVLFIFLVGTAYGSTNPNDFTVLNDFRNGLENPDLLGWPATGNDPCGPPSWSHVFCSNGRVTQIQVQNKGLKGRLPQNLNQLDMLQNVGLQKNNFYGKLPSLSGLSNLQYAYLDFNQFDSIPADFFHGLSSIRVLALDDNPLNQSSGWTIPNELGESTQLANFSCSSCNIVGQIPDFFGELSSLSMLRLSDNKLTGGIPSSFQDTMLQILCLNNQEGGGLSGSIDMIGSMVGLTVLWLHGNQFTGPIPDNIGSLTSLRELRLAQNDLVGVIPPVLATLDLQVLDLSNNMLMGSVPKFREDASYDSNSFCLPDPGEQCAPAVNLLLEFLHDVNYPKTLASEWTGNDPCSGHWLGITCTSSNQISVINLANLGINGTLSPSLAGLSSLVEIHLEENNLHGVVPANLTLLRSLRLLNISWNDFRPPLPKFSHGVKVVTDGNAELSPGGSNSPLLPVLPPESPSPSAPVTPESPPSNHSSGNDRGSSSNAPGHGNQEPIWQNPSKSRLVAIVAAAAGCFVFALVAAMVTLYCIRKRKKAMKRSSSVVAIEPKDSPDSSSMVKIAIEEDMSVKKSQNGSGPASKTSDGWGNAQGMDAANHPVFSFDVLEKVTNNFAPENELGRGGFGVVYKGRLEDGKEIAVKRMESGVLSSKGVTEFRAEIAALSRLRHRNLVSLLGYSVEGNERLLVYECMPQGALSRHLLRWKALNLEPLSWTRRLNIALDVARGVEYLHTLANENFIHRDLKSANILLDDDFRAKVSDFGLVKLAPNEEKSVATRLAGTFGYLAPEYAVMGKITTKVDVFSFGVVLMELLTGLAALDEHRPEENQYLAEWFWNIKSDRDRLIASIDPALNAKEDIYPSIYVISELAGHCTARDPNHRPDMGYIVNVLAQLVDIWKPYKARDQPYGGGSSSSAATSFALTPLPELLKGWQQHAYNLDFSSTSKEAKESPPAKPQGFADTFSSDDAR